MRISVEDSLAKGNTSETDADAGAGK